MSIVSIKFPIEKSGINPGEDGFSEKEIAQAVKFNIKNVLLTSPNELLFDLNFGVGLKELLFEFPTDEKLNEYRSRIRTGLQVYCPYIDVLNLSLEALDESLVVRLEYEIPQTETIETLQLILSQAGAVSAI